MVKMARLAKGVIVENVGPDLLLVVPGRVHALRLTGDAAEAFLKIQAGGYVDSNNPVVKELASQGVVELPGVSRRGLIKAGAVGAGAGIAVLAMPGAAAASSPSGITGTYRNPNPPGQYFTQFEFPASALGGATPIQFRIAPSYTGSVFNTNGGVVSFSPGGIPFTGAVTVTITLLGGASLTGTFVPAG